MDLLNGSVKRNMKGLRELREISTVPRSLTLSMFVSHSRKKGHEKSDSFHFLYMYMPLVNLN